MLVWVQYPGRELTRVYLGLRQPNVTFRNPSSVVCDHLCQGMPAAGSSESTTQL